MARKSKIEQNETVKPSRSTTTRQKKEAAVIEQDIVEEVEEVMPEDFDDDEDDYFTDDDMYMRNVCSIIGRNVRYQRKKRSFSIDTLAECIELSSSYVGLLERGDRCPSLKSLLRLCDLFNIEPNALLIDRQKRSAGALTLSEDKQKSDVYSAVISLLHGLNQDELGYVATQLKAFRKLAKKSEKAEMEGKSSPTIYQK